MPVNAKRLAEAAGKTTAVTRTRTCWPRPSRCVRSSSPRRLDGGAPGSCPPALRAYVGRRRRDGAPARRVRRGDRASHREPSAGRRRSFHDADKQACNGTADSGSRRSFDQCMADALEHFTSSSDGGQVSKPFADICVVAHVDEATGKLIAELPDDVRLPQSVLEELACNARFTGVIYDRRGRPIWRAHSVRRATKAQRQLLIARDGGCFACGAHPDICDAHHVRPVSQGGATSLDNMVLACWRCHHKIHHLGWQIHGPPGRRTLHPPDTVHFGPAHAPERPSLFHPGTPAAPAQPQMLETAAAHSPNSLARSMPAVACAPAHQQVNGSRRDGARQAQSGDPPTRPGPAAARAAPARSRARRAGAPDIARSPSGQLTL